MNDLASLVGVSTESVAGLLGRLTAAGLTVAAAESLTGGLLTAVLTEIPGSSSVVRGGLVVYATDLKHRLAGVDPKLLAERGPVDPLVAAALAQGAREGCAAGIGVGLTGVAGPDSQDGVAVGTWFVAVAGPGDYRELRRGQPHPDQGNRPAGTVQTRTELRGAIRAAAVRAALEMLAHAAATVS